MVKNGLENIWRNHKTFVILLLVGLFLRVLFIYFQGLSNDELSAWYRTRYEMGEEFWRLGVREGDMHPAFYQLVLWFWVRIFGDSEFSLRATSLLFFIANVSLLYLISCRFFSKYTGQLITAFYAVLGFLVVNTTTARPYNSGVFFLLLAFYLILRLHEKNNAFGWKHMLLLSLAFLGAMTSHYFAFLSVGILGFLSLFYVEKSNQKYIYQAGGIALGIFLLFHFQITSHQLGQGGLGWLDPPHFWWFFEFSQLTFQNSTLLLLLALGLIYYVKKGTTKPSPSQGFSILMFFAIGFVAYLISILFTPILRELVFQFLLPFVFLGVIGPVFPEKKSDFAGKSIQFMPFVIVFVFGLHTITAYGLFQPVHYGVFRELADHQKELEERWGKTSFTVAQNTNNFAYLNYYLQDSTATESISDWSNPEAVYLLNDRVTKAKTPYFLYNWTNNHHDPMFLECIRRSFPRLESKTSYFNSGSYNFSRKVMDKSFSMRLIMDIDEGIIAENGEEFFGGGFIQVKELRAKMGKCLYLLLEGKGSVQNADEFYLVANAVYKNDKQIMKGKFPLLYCAPNQQRLNPGSGMKEMFVAFNLPKELRDEDRIKFYCWNPKKGIVLFNNFKLYALY